MFFKSSMFSVKKQSMYLEVIILLVTVAHLRCSSLDTWLLLLLRTRAIGPDCGFGFARFVFGLPALGV